MEEQKKTGEEVTLGFNSVITTKPKVVKYLTSGRVTLSGKSANGKKKLEINQKKDSTDTLHRSARSTPSIASTCVAPFLTHPTRDSTCCTPWRKKSK